MSHVTIRSLITKIGPMCTQQFILQGGKPVQASALEAQQLNSQLLWSVGRYPFSPLDLPIRQSK